MKVLILKIQTNVIGAGVVNHLGYKMDIEEKLKKIIAKSFNVALDKVVDDADLIEDLGADSLGVFEMIINIEDEFGVEFRDKELVTFKTVGETIIGLKPLLEKN
jgi:acyl carrier protein